MAEHAKRRRPSLCACPDCCDVLTKRKERITAALSRGGYSFRHDSFVIHFSSDFFETYRPIGFSSFPSIRRLPLTAPVKRRYRSLHPPASFSSFACFHYTANGLTCQDFLTIYCKNPRGQACGGDRWTFHARGAHNPCKVSICAYIELRKVQALRLQKPLFDHRLRFAANCCCCFAKSRSAA